MPTKICGYLLLLLVLHVFLMALVVHQLNFECIAQAYNKPIECTNAPQKLTQNCTFAEPTKKRREQKATTNQIYYSNEEKKKLFIRNQMEIIRLNLCSSKIASSANHKSNCIALRKFNKSTFDCLSYVKFNFRR